MSDGVKPPKLPPPRSGARASGESAHVKKPSVTEEDIVTQLSLDIEAYFGDIKQARDRATEALKFSPVLARYKGLSSSCGRRGRGAPGAPD